MVIYYGRKIPCGYADRCPAGFVIVTIVSKLVGLFYLFLGDLQITTYFL